MTLLGGSMALLGGGGASMALLFGVSIALLFGSSLGCSVSIALLFRDGTSTIVGGSGLSWFSPSHSLIASLAVGAGSASRLECVNLFGALIVNLRLGNPRLFID